MAGAEDRPWQLGFSVSPDLGYRHLTNQSGGSNTNVIISSRRNSETPAFGYSSGLHLRYTANARLFLEAGLQFSNNGYRMKELSIISATYQTIGKADVRIRHQRLDIPLRLVFHPVEDSRFTLGAGLLYNIPVEVKVITELRYTDGSSETLISGGEQYGDGKNGLSALFSAGYLLPLSKQWMLSGELMHRAGLMNISPGKPIGTRLWNFGLNLGLYYRL